jgi:hypothetical protein
MQEERALESHGVPISRGERVSQMRPKWRSTSLEAGLSSSLPSLVCQVRTVLFPFLSHFLPGPSPHWPYAPIHQYTPVTLPRGAKYPILNWSTSPLQSPAQSIAPRFASQIDSSFRLLGTVHSTLRALSICNHNKGQKRGSGDFVGTPTVLIIAVHFYYSVELSERCRLFPKNLRKCL